MVCGFATRRVKRKCCAVSCNNVMGDSFTNTDLAKDFISETGRESFRWGVIFEDVELGLRRVHPYRLTGEFGPVPFSHSGLLCWVVVMLIKRRKVLTWAVLSH